MWTNKLGLIEHATVQTIEMVFVSLLFAVLIGLPLGVLLYVTRHTHLFKKPVLHSVLGMLVNIVRSIPFIILLVAITPFTRFIVGTSIGTTAAMVPLAISAIPFFARLVESALTEVSPGLVEVSLSMGATLFQIISKVLVRESRAVIVRAATLTAITLIGYSAMAGAIGGGGLGNIAITYGYERFEVHIMILTVVILILMVQCVQWVGDWIARQCAPNGVR